MQQQARLGRQQARVAVVAAFCGRSPSLVGLAAVRRWSCGWPREAKAALLRRHLDGVPLTRLAEHCGFGVRTLRR